MDKNPSIQCTVDECKFHAKSENYCTLNQIMIGTHEKSPKLVECTDCNSFVLQK